MNSISNISSSDSFTSRMQALQELLSEDTKTLTVEGLPGSSRALFLARLKKVLSRPILVLTANQNSGESLLGDLKYFFRLEKIRQNPEFFPNWELLPYETLSPLPEVSGERLGILDRLSEGAGCGFLVAPVEAMMQCVLPRSKLSSMVFAVKTGDALEREWLEACLVESGYSRVSMVESLGEFSVRGDIVDVFQPAFQNPLRIEFFGDQVESLRSFDINSQVSMEPLEQVRILPVRELCPTALELERGIQSIEEHALKQGADPSHAAELVERLKHLSVVSGLESLAPFFYEERQTLFDYIPKDTVIVLDEEEEVIAEAEKYQELIFSEYEIARERGDIALSPERFYLSSQEFIDRSAAGCRLSLNTLKLSDDESQNTQSFQVKTIPVLPGQFESLATQMVRWEEAEMQVVIAAPTRGQVRRVQQLVDEYGFSAGVDLGALSSGFEFPGAGKVFVAEHEIFGRTHKHRYRRKPKSQSFQRGFKDLKAGDHLVHIDYGIGRYLGTKELKTGVGGGEFLEILYADDQKLYVPMDALSYIQKYVGQGEGAVPLNKMGGVSWKRQKAKAREAIREMAEDLLKLYAKREMAKGVSYQGNAILMQEFADSFEYEETEDQMKAIEELEEDLEKEKPMDRLVCGDVGYGKTEVAMRAAFKVVLEKKQVAVLVPTTILAQQHMNTFIERFRNHPVQIDSLSRFRTAKEQKAIFAKMKTGELDIVIGTHRLLSKDAKFADLGLIIIDEEQRFGVLHKEKLKKLRSTVDILTLTATPIPRTLHFSLMGVRDLSVIETPPKDRLAVKTFVRKFNDKIIHEAITREMDRQGQIFFVHNKVKSIHTVGEMIRKIMPDIRIGIAHGQLPEKQLENVMRQFIDHEIDLLLCTSIIESGLDIPAANTIIVNRADEFGLAQLYQLRGRVGRYKHQAYAYLLIPGAMAITPEARKRISAIEEMSELGSGFQLAARDMEIRGTGNMLGHKQSGHISTIGFDLYCKLIEETVKDLKGEKVTDQIEPEIDLLIRGYIPKDYISDLNQRLEVYRRIQLISEKSEREALEAELLDRYGKLPEPVEKLLGLLDIKTLCRKLHISEMKVRSGVARLSIEPSTPIAPGAIAALADSHLTFLSEYVIGIEMNGSGWRNNIIRIKSYLDKMQASLPKYAPVQDE